MIRSGEVTRPASIQALLELVFFVTNTPLPVLADSQTWPPSSVSGSGSSVATLTSPPTPWNATPPGLSTNGAPPEPWPENT